MSTPPRWADALVYLRQRLRHTELSHQVAKRRQMVDVDFSPRTYLTCILLGGTDHDEHKTARTIDLRGLRTPTLGRTRPSRALPGLRRRAPAHGAVRGVGRSLVRAARHARIGHAPAAHAACGAALDG